jgi:hypothetical protein
MIGNIRVHGTDHAQVIGTASQIRKQFTHYHAAVALRRKLERRGNEPSAFLRFRNPCGLFAFVVLQRWLGVKRIDVRRTAVHEQVNHPFGARLEVRACDRATGWGR